MLNVDDPATANFVKCNFCHAGRVRSAGALSSRSRSPPSLPPFPHSLSLSEEQDRPGGLPPVRRGAKGAAGRRVADAVAESPRQRRRGAADFLEIQERNPISRYRCTLKHRRTSLIEQRAERTGRRVCRQKKRSVELAKAHCIVGSDESSRNHGTLSSLFRRTRNVKELIICRHTGLYARARTQPVILYVAGTLPPGLSSQSCRTKRAQHYSFLPFRFRKKIHDPAKNGFYLLLSRRKIR